MQVIMLFRRNLDTGEPFDAIEIVKVLDDNVKAMDFIEAFEAAASPNEDITDWFWHIESVKGTYLPPDLSEDLAHPYKG